MPRFTKGSKGREVRFFFSVASEEDEMLVAYCQNPPHPYRTAAEYVRAVLTTYALPLAALQAGMDNERLAKLATEATYKLRSQATEIEQKCCLQLPPPDKEKGNSKTNSLIVNTLPAAPEPMGSDDGASVEVVTPSLDKRKFAVVGGASATVEVVKYAEFDPFAEK